MRGPAQHSKQRIAVCLVERNALAASYLRGVLERDPCFQIITDGHAFESPNAWNLLPPIFAIDVGTLSGSLEAHLTLLRCRVRDVKILILNEAFPRDELRRLSSLEIQGLLTYSEVRDQLRPALRAISEGDTWFGTDVVSEFSRYPGMFQLGNKSGRSIQDIFTQRERLIVGLVERRLGNKEIAAALSVSESTVKFHLSNIFRKLAVRDRLSAAELASSLNLNPA